jgi:hypothetical protein
MEVRLPEGDAPSAQQKVNDPGVARREELSEGPGTVGRGEASKEDVVTGTPRRGGALPERLLASLPSSSLARESESPGSPEKTVMNALNRGL